MTIHFRLGQYARHDRNVWYSPCGVCVTDEVVIARLEAEYRDHQRQHATDPRPPIIKPPQGGPVAARVKGRKVRREWRGEAKS